MGRDLLGDDTPPDEIDIIDSSSTGSEQNPVPNFGWPICYGKNVHDTDFDHNTYIRNPCMEPFEIGSHIDLPAHSAPLGLAFFPKDWPEEYRDDLLVAYHGSWNRSEPTGYKIVRVKLDSRGNFEGVEDFITGWLRRSDDKSEVGVPTVVSGLTPEGALGRPVDLVFHKGSLYISDDKAGVVYKVVRSTK